MCYVVMCTGTVCNHKYKHAITCTLVIYNYRLCNILHGHLVGQTHHRWCYPCRSWLQFGQALTAILPFLSIFSSIKCSVSNALRFSLINIHSILHIYTAFSASYLLPVSLSNPAILFSRVPGGVETWAPESSPS